MTMPNQPPYAVFEGSLGDHATGSWYPAQAEVSNGFVTLWIGSPTGWTQAFSVPATEVTVKSAAQRVTLVVRGQSYPILAKPRAVTRALGYNVGGVVATALDKPVLNAGMTVSQGINQVSAASAWNTGGGPEFIAAARFSGAQVSRLGYGPLIAIGCIGGLVVTGIVVAIALIAIVV